MEENVKKDCYALWKNCFGDRERYMDYYFKEKCRDNEVLTDIENNHVVSMVHLNPYELMWQGKKVKSYYIVGVATEEKFRKQGRMRKLLEQAFFKMRKEQVPFAFLMPANKKIYEPFDFHTIYRQERILAKGIYEPLMKAAQLKSAGNRVRMKYFTELTPMEQEEMTAYCQKKLSEEFDIYVVRDLEYYRCLQKEMEGMEGNVAVFRTQNGSIAGVLSYGLEEGYPEVMEALIEGCFTREILTLLLNQNSVKDKSKIQFYESYFLDKAQLEEMGTELKYSSKATIMAKVLDCGSSFEKVFGGQRVYLNELV